jgi:hypothetical protein
MCFLNAFLFGGNNNMVMTKFIVDENPSTNGANKIHNASAGCDELPITKSQILIGYFANQDLAYKRARMNWPTEKVVLCEKCCSS